MFTKQEEQGYNRDFIWATDHYGKPTKCTAKPENRGKGRCPHYCHQQEGETLPEFLDRAKKENQERLDKTNERLVARVDLYKEKLSSFSDSDSDNDTRNIIYLLETFTRETRSKMATSDTMEKVDAAVANFNEIINETLDKTKYYSSQNRKELKESMRKFVDEIDEQRFTCNVSINDLYGDPDTWINHYKK